MTTLRSRPSLDSNRAPRTTPAVWQAWLSQHVTAQAAPLVDPARRLVVVAPHPGVEVLSCGLLMLQHAARGGQGHVVAVTDGEGGHAQAGPSVRELQQQRSRERCEGLMRLGLETVPVTPLPLPDGAVAEAGARLHAALLSLLTPRDALVTTWRLDGHPDHGCCGRVTLELAQRLGLPLLQAPVWMWRWAEPGTPRIPWHALQVVDAPVRARMRKAAALHAHQSQLTASAAMGAAGLDDFAVECALWPREYFFTATG